MNFFLKLNAIVYNKNLHPFLLCIVVVLYYYNEVEAMCSIAQPITCVIVLLSLIGLCTKLIKYFDYDILVSSIILSFWTFIFFFTMHLVNFITKFSFFEYSQAKFSFTALIIGGVLIQFFLLKLKKNVNRLVKLAQYLNILFLILILIELCRTLIFLNVRKAYIENLEIGEAKGKYNLFILIMDGYARADNLKKYWNYDNKEFISFLKRKEFFIVEKSKSNYCLSEQTVCSISSLDYLKMPTNTVYRTNQIFNNPLFVSATKMGYRCSNLGLYPIENVKNAYDFLYSVKNLYEHIILQTPLFAVVSFYNKRIDRNMTKIDIGKFADLLGAFINKKKNLVLFHSLLTHAPYSKLDSTDFHQMMMSNPLKEVFTWDKYKAQVYPPNKEISPCRDCYLNQFKVTNRLMAKTLENNWGDLSANSVIIVMSDHGFRFIDKDTIGPSNKEAYENFAAIYFPDKDYTTLNDTMTILNSARMCVNKALGTKLSYVKDTSNLK